MTDEFKREHHVGPGGMKCPCCGPAPGKERKQMRRRVRAKLKNKLHKELREGKHE